MTRTNQLKLFAIMAAAALALCLLALVAAQPAEAAFPGKQPFMLLLPPFAATALGWMWLGYALLSEKEQTVAAVPAVRQKIANPWRQPALSYRRKEA